MKKKELILKELDHLIETAYFKTKPLQRKFLQHFSAVYRTSDEIVTVRNQDLVAIYENETPEIKNDGNKFLSKKNAVSKHIGKLRENLKEFYQGPGKARQHVISIPKNEHGNYSLDVLSRQSKKGIREGPPKAVQGNVLVLSDANNTGSVLRPQSVTEIILLVLKGVDRKRLVQIQRAAAGIMWGVLLVGLAVLIVLLIGIPYWPAMPLMGLSLAGLLMICTCIAVLARPITRLSDMPFRRWWGDTFCMYRREALVLARYSGRCMVDGCYGHLSVVQEGHERTDLFYPLPRRWIIVCKNVPTEHPRMPFDFTALDRAQAPNGSSERELARRA